MIFTFTFNKKLKSLLNNIPWLILNKENTNSIKLFLAWTKDFIQINIVLLRFDNYVTTNLNHIEFQYGWSSAWTIEPNYVWTGGTTSC